MPNWSDENGRYWWQIAEPGQARSYVEIPHAPVNPRDDCDCKFCKFHLVAKSVEEVTEQDVAEVLRRIDRALKA